METKYIQVTRRFRVSPADLDDREYKLGHIVSMMVQLFIEYQDGEAKKIIWDDEYRVLDCIPKEKLDKFYALEPVEGSYGFYYESKNIRKKTFEKHDLNASIRQGPQDDQGE